MSTSRPTVLVVDDEPMIRMFVADILTDAGYAVIEAGSTDAAIDIIEDEANLKAVVTDINMPGGADGIELARRIARSHPDVRVLVVSGRMRPATYTLPEGSGFLGKPFSDQQLLDSMAGMLGRAPGRRRVPDGGNDAPMTG